MITEDYWKQKAFTQKFQLDLDLTDIWHPGPRYDSSKYKLDRPSAKEKNRKSSWINEKWSRWENSERVCCIETENI